jgi:glutamine cyclotransferase
MKVAQENINHLIINAIKTWLVLLTMLIPFSSYSADQLAQYGFRVVQSYPHSSKVFTQGLEFHNGLIYEGAGQRGESKVLKRRLDSIEPIEFVNLENVLFGEGITILDQRLYQLTWKSGRGFIYDAHTLEPKGEFKLPGDGWGLSNNGQQLIMSDGSDTLSFIDTDSLAVVKRLKVRYRGRPLTRLNELEWVNGVIYANIWQTDWIVMIDPQSGNVVGRLSLKGLLPKNVRTSRTDVLNGIAYDNETGRLFVTGKYWPRLYQIELVPLVR